MNQFLIADPWKIIEDRFYPNRVKASESLFSIGNGTMGQRANFEEQYSGKSFHGSYIGGVYYPDKTRVGWWKNGYPEYFAKVLNSAFWIGIDVKVNGQELDLAKLKILNFYRELDMRHGTLTRIFTVEMKDKTEVMVKSVRFVSLARTELGAVQYSVTPVNSDATVEFASYIEGDVRNEDANYNEKFWELVGQTTESVTMRTKKTGFQVCWMMANEVNAPDARIEKRGREERVEEIITARAADKQPLVLTKYVGIVSSLNHQPADLVTAAARVVKEAREAGFDALLEEQRQSWLEKWKSCDIEIGGDEAAQQGIRYCIFQLLQTYTGKDSRLNVGPKGFTGEKYGGGTYWDTEAYCLPFYMAAVGAEVGRQLLIYRYNQLDKAIENAEKLGFTGGAALYPMVTMNGEESHNEWEITFEEIHRNGAIAFAIFNYIRYTDDRKYLAEYGLEVLIAIARFWAQRVNWSEEKRKYVILGVTGPNEYENNVNNNWYTNYIAVWCLKYAAFAVDYVRQHDPGRYEAIVAKTLFDAPFEVEHWYDIIGKMYFPKDVRRGIFLQQDGYLDKEQTLVRDLSPEDRPLNRKWSWDRILRSDFIKQADVLQGLYFFEPDFDLETIRRNFRFYESRTVHESSLSPCVHAILAAEIGDMDKAYEMYLRTSRLDLDDYNREIEEGLHITSMAGSWMSIVEGYGGMRVRENKLSFSPKLPEEWEYYSFKIKFRGRVVKVTVQGTETVIDIEEGEPLEILLDGRPEQVIRERTFAAPPLPDEA